MRLLTPHSRCPPTTPFNPPITLWKCNQADFYNCLRFNFSLYIFHGLDDFNGGFFFAKGMERMLLRWIWKLA